MYSFSRQKQSNIVNTQVKWERIQLDDLMAQRRAGASRRLQVDEPLSISIAEVSSTGIDGNFLHLQLLIHILVGMNPSPCEREELLEFCRTIYKDDPVELGRLSEFERDYEKERALWW
jgi:hypothetical protein